MALANLRLVPKIAGDIRTIKGGYTKALLASAADGVPMNYTWDSNGLIVINSPALGVNGTLGLKKGMIPLDAKLVWVYEKGAKAPDSL